MTETTDALVNPNFGQPVNRTEEECKILFGQTAALVR